MSFTNVKKKKTQTNIHKKALKKALYAPHYVRHRELFKRPSTHLIYGRHCELCSVKGPLRTSLCKALWTMFCKRPPETGKITPPPFPVRIQSTNPVMLHVISTQNKTNSISLGLFQFCIFNNKCMEGRSFCDHVTFLVCKSNNYFRGVQFHNWLELDSVYTHNQKKKTIKHVSI